MDHLVYVGSTTGDLAYSSTCDLENRLKEVEDRLGITQEREKARRIAWFRQLRGLVLMAREAGVAPHEYIKRTHLTARSGIPKAVLEAYKKAGRA